MADLIAMEQDDTSGSWEFINLDNAMRWWFYMSEADQNDYGAWLLCRIARLPVVPYVEGEEEHQIALTCDSPALLVLNELRRRCGLPAIAHPFPADDDSGHAG